MITSISVGDIARDHTQADGIYTPRRASQQATARWVRRYTTSWRGACPHCGRGLEATSQFLFAADCTLVRYRSGSYGLSGYQLEAEPDWARVCGCNTPPTTTNRREAPTMTMTRSEPAPVTVRGDVVAPVRTGGALAVREDQNDWTPEQRAALAHMGVGDAPKTDQRIFLHQVQRTGLDPFVGQIHMVGRRDKTKGRTVWTIQTAIDGFRLVAERTGLYAGQTEPQWCGPDGQWLDVWVPSHPPVAARVGVLRKDWAHPMYVVAKFSEYAVHKASGGLGPFWQRMPSHMIAKVAEALALRKAFPQDLSGLYTSDEMGRDFGAGAAAPKSGQQPQRQGSQQAPSAGAEPEASAQQGGPAPDWEKKIQNALALANAEQRYEELRALYTKAVNAGADSATVHQIVELGEEAHADVVEKEKESTDSTEHY